MDSSLIQPVFSKSLQDLQTCTILVIADPKTAAAARSQRHQSRNECRPVLPAKHALHQPRPIAACRSAGGTLTASSRQKGPARHALSPPSRPGNLATDAKKVKSPHTRHTCRPYVDPMSPYVTPYVDPKSTPEPPGNILSRAAAQTSCYGKGKNILKTDDIGRHWTTSIPYRYPAPSPSPAALAIICAPNRQTVSTSRPRAYGLPRPAPAAPNSPARSQPPWQRTPRTGTAISYV